MVAAPASSGAGGDLACRFPDRREEGATTLRQCQLVMIRMLRILDEVATRQGISYWITAGTLIGALRHKGMIPWDCDIDVGITLEDFAALERVVHLLPPDIFFQTDATDPGYDMERMAKLRDRHSCYYEWMRRNPEYRGHHGLQVDLILYRENAQGQLVNPFRGTAYDREEIFPLQRVEFEGARLPAPRNPSRYIMRRYGNYLALPPREARFPYQGWADPFSPCDHPESRPYRIRKPLLRCRHRLARLVTDLRLRGV